MKYIAGIESPQERVLMEYLLSHLVGFLVRDPVRAKAALTAPVDAFLHITAAHDALRNTALVDRIRSGHFSSFDEIPDLF